MLNTNADTAAGEIAAALHAECLVFLTDVEGVLTSDRRVHLAALDRRRRTHSSRQASRPGGMIPKLAAAVRAAGAGCATRIVGGTAPGALARVLAGDGGGTTVRG